MRKYENGIFLDSSFVISTQIVNDLFYEKAVDLMLNFDANKNTLILTPLVMDEFWYTIKGALRSVTPAKYFSEAEKKLTRLTENILSAKGVVFVTPVFKKVDILGVLDIMSKYDLRPRDALIVKSMEILGVNKIATFDTDFDRVRGISVVK